MQDARIRWLYLTGALAACVLIVAAVLVGTIQDQEVVYQNPGPLPVWHFDTSAGLGGKLLPDNQYHDVGTFNNFDAPNLKYFAQQERISLQIATRAHDVNNTIGNGKGFLFEVRARYRDGAEISVDSWGKVARGRHQWEDIRAGWSRGIEYILLGEVMTHRVAMRVLEADGKTLVSECPAVYVSERNNHRTGGLGFITRGGSREFWDWGRQ